MVALPYGPKLPTILDAASREIPGNDAYMRDNLTVSFAINGKILALNSAYSVGSAAPDQGLAAR
jgi:hypothetical protein